MLPSNICANNIYSRHPFPCYLPYHRRSQLRATVPLLAIRSSRPTMSTAFSSLLQLPKASPLATTIVDFLLPYTQRIAQRRIIRWLPARFSKEARSCASNLAQDQMPQHRLVASYCPQTLVRVLRQQQQAPRTEHRPSDSRNGPLHAALLLRLLLLLLYLHKWLALF